MKLSKKKMLALFTAIMTMGSFVGCGASSGNNSAATSIDIETGEVDTSEEVKLTMYLLGEKTPDFDKVYTEINKILKEKCNATVDVKFLSWAEHATTYSLLFSANQDFDLIFTASSWGHYEEVADMGGFYELTPEFVEKYAPGISEVVPDVAWNQAKIDGKIFMVPNYQNEFGDDCIAIRGDLMKKYGYDTIDSEEKLEAFFADLVANESGITPFGTQGGAIQYMYEFQNQGYSLVSGTPSELFVYNYSDPADLEIKYILDWDHFTDYAHKMQDMYQKGYWSPDSGVSNDERQTGFINGTAACMIWNAESCYNYAKQANEAHPEWECQVINVAPNNARKVKPYIGNGIAINANSKNKERAMMVLNEFYTNPDVYDLAYIGIEGEHWEAVGEDQYKTLPAEANYGVNSNCNWGWTNENIKRTEFVEGTDIAYESKEAVLKNFEEHKTEGHKYDAFNFDTTNVSTEVATVNSLVTQYYDPIKMGMVDDVDAAIAELRGQLEAAGIQRIYDEIKRQVEEQ